MVRYRTRDLSRLQVGECKCGRTMRVMDRVHARSDDMLIIHGVNVFPSQIEACLMKVPEVAPHYMIELSSTDTMDRFEIKVEVTADSMSDSMSKMEAVRKRVAASIKEIVGLSPKIMLVAPGSLPRSEGKIKRVIDNRSYLFLLFFGTLHSDVYIFPFLLCFSLLFFSQLFVRPPQTVILPLHFFFLWMVLTPVSCTMSQTSVHSSSGTLSIRSLPLNLFLTSTV